MTLKQLIDKYLPPYLPDDGMMHVDRVREEVRKDAERARAKEISRLKKTGMDNIKERFGKGEASFNVLLATAIFAGCPESQRDSIRDEITSEIVGAFRSKGYGASAFMRAIYITWDVGDAGMDDGKDAGSY